MNKIQMPHPVYWVSTVISKLNEKTDSMRGAFSSLASLFVLIRNLPEELEKLSMVCQNFSLLKNSSQYVQDLVDRINPLVRSALPTINGFFIPLDTTKDYLAWFDIFGQIKDLKNPEKTKTEEARGELYCKLSACTLESVFLLPNKFGWVNLGAWCEKLGSLSPYLSFISPTTIKLVTFPLLIRASLYAIQEIQRSTVELQNDKAKYEGKIRKVGKILELIERENEFKEAVKLYKFKDANPSNTDTKDKKRVEDVLSRHETLTNEKEKHLKEMSALILNGDKVAIQRESAQLEQINTELHNLEQKNKRFSTLYQYAFDEDFYKKLSLDVDVKWIVPKEQINFDSAKQLMQRKYRKYNRAILVSESQIGKGGGKRNVEIAKIALLAFVTLGLLISQAYLPVALAGLAAYTPFVVSATWLSSLFLFAYSTRRLIFDNFYYVDPKVEPVPTTAL